MLSWYLRQEGKTVMIVDNDHDKASSKVAAGVINPVTGRRYVTTWRIEEIMPFAVEAYDAIGAHLASNLVYEKSVIDFFASPQMLNAFVDRIREGDNPYLHPFPDQNHFNQFFQYDFGCGEVKPAYTVHLQLLLAKWRKKLAEDQCLLEATFELPDLTLTEDGVMYQHITAQKVIFCDGIAASQNPWFELLPFSANKGEALIIECPDMTNEHLFKKSLALVPLPGKDTFWVGSNYKWEFETDDPTPEFYAHATSVLNGWLKKPYKVLAHKAAVRPATLERRPFVGLHPLYPAAGILNGMGTKGTSLAPFFANELAQFLVHGTPITPEANVQRFSRILSK